MDLVTRGVRPGKEFLVTARILLVEDNLDIREITTRLLLDSGYYVESATNGEEALEHFRRHKFDLIITDIFMPVMDGNQFIRELMKYKEYTTVPPVIAMSYNQFDILPSTIISLIALKPMRFGQLRSAISNILEGYNPHEI